MQIIQPRDLGFSDFAIDIAEDDAPAWVVGTSYGLGDRVVREHKVYASAIANNQSIDPLGENQSLTEARWLLVGHTNAFSFMDRTIGNRTIGSNSVTLTIANVSGIDAMMLVGMKASTIRVQAFDTGAVEIYDQVFSLSGRNVYNFYEWFTDPLGAAQTKLVVDDLPTSIATMTLTIAGSDIEIGELLVGDILNAGTALMESSGEVKYYGRVAFNAYGRLERVDGPTRTIMRYRSHVPAPQFATIKDQMDRLTGSLVGAIGSSKRGSTIQLGYLGTIKWAENLPGDYIINFTVEGST